MTVENKRVFNKQAVDIGLVAFLKRNVFKASNILRKKLLHHIFVYLVMAKTSDFLIDVLEFLVSIWTTNFFLEMAKVTS